MMPRMNGYEVCLHLKNDNELKSIPIIFITALTQLEEITKAFAVGGVDYITKPIRKEELWARVSTHLTIAKQKKELTQGKEKIEELYAEFLGTQGALKEANFKLKGLASTDPLTSLYNRRHFFEVARNDWKLAQENQKSATLIMIDIDFFKTYNDHYGQQKGDKCLKEVAICLKKIFMKSSDHLARYGGEEFIAMLVNTDLQQSEHLISTLKNAIEALAVPHEKSGIADHLTLSIGAVTTTPNLENSLQQAIKKADEALYRAKESGRNRWVIISA